MRIWRFHEFGPITNLRMEESPVPEPGPGEALVKLRFASLNPADRFLIQKMYPRPGNPPFAVGRDGSGEIVESRGGKFSPGDRVVVLRGETGITRDGTLAEYVTVAEDSLALLPEGWSWEEGAAGRWCTLTAWRALVRQGEIQPGQLVLVTGSSGGVGTAAVQQAKAFGCDVVAMSRHEEKRRALIELGADYVFDSSDPRSFEKAAKEALGDRRCQIVVENLGGPFLQTSINLCGESARVEVVGLLSGLTSEIVVGLLIFKQIRIEGVLVGAWEPGEAQTAWTGIVSRLNRSGVRPVLDRVFPMREVQEAFGRLEEGPLGKILIDVQG